MEAGLSLFVEQNGRVHIQRTDGSGNIGVDYALELEGLGNSQAGVAARVQAAPLQPQLYSRMGDEPIWRSPLKAVDAGLLVSREYYAPATGRGFLRVLDRYYNVSGQARTISPILNSRPLYWGQGNLQQTSSGDDQLTADDSWLSLRKRTYGEQGDVPGPISTVHVFADQAGRASLNSDELFSDAYYSWRIGYRFEIPANEHRVVMSFLAVENAEAGAQDMASVLQGLSENALKGISAADRERLVNFTPCRDDDLDLLCNAAEAQHGSSDSNPDSDGDGFNDALEVQVGSDPSDPASLPEFEVYGLEDADGMETSRVLKQSGFTGPMTTAGDLNGWYVSLDVKNTGELWAATSGSADGFGYDTYALPSLMRQEDGAWVSRDGQFLDDAQGNNTDFLMAETIESEDGTPQDALVLRQLRRNQWGDSEEQRIARLPKDLRCGAGLAHWQGEPLLLNGCSLSRLSANNGWVTLAELTFGDGFGSEPVVLSMDDMPQAGGAMLLVEDEVDGNVRRSLGFVDLKTGQVKRLGEVPIGVKAISVKFRGFQNQPKWPIDIVPS